MVLMMILVISVELPSLTFQRRNFTPANLISSILFGDGAGAVILTSDERSGCLRVVGADDALDQAVQLQAGLGAFGQRIGGEERGAAGCALRGRRVAVAEREAVPLETSLRRQVGLGPARRPVLGDALLVGEQDDEVGPPQWRPPRRGSGRSPGLRAQQGCRGHQQSAALQQLASRDLAHRGRSC